jgi:hypothetical protein
LAVYVHIVCPCAPLRPQFLDQLGITVSEVGSFGTVSIEVVEFPRLASKGNEFPFSRAHSAIAEVLKINRVASKPAIETITLIITLLYFLVER